jgi:hypothetical protein
LHAGLKTTCCRSCRPAVLPFDARLPYLSILLPNLHGLIKPLIKPVMAAPMTVERSDETASSDDQASKTPLQLSTANGWLLALEEDELVITAEDPSARVKSWWDPAGLCQCLPIKSSTIQETIPAQDP